MTGFLDVVIAGNTMQSYIIALAIIMLFIGIGQIFSQIIVGILKKLALRTKTALDDIIVAVLEKPLVFALFIAGFYYAGFYISFTARNTQLYYSIIKILIVINIIWALMKFLDAVIEHYLRPLINNSESQLDDQLLPFARTTAKVLIILIGAIFLIKSFGYDVTSLVAGLGIGGLAFALAAQPLLSNLFGGVAIIADKPFKIGDRIRVDDKFEGYVTQVGMRSTTIRSPVDTFVHIPNSVIAATAVENKSREDKDHGIRFSFSIGIAQSTTSDKIREAIQIIKDILAEHPAIIKNDPTVGQYVGFSEFKETSLQLYVEYSFDHSYGSTKTKTEINLAIKERFEKAGIAFAFPMVQIKKE